MEFTVDRSVLLDTLAKTQGIIDKRTTTQVLSNVLMEVTEDGNVTVTCTDYDVMWSGAMAAEVTSPGIMATNGKQLFEAVRNFHDGRVVFATEGTEVKLVCGASQARFGTADTADFPRLAVDDAIETFALPKATLRALIEQTHFSISHDEARPALNGALFKVAALSSGEGVHLTLVTTDGHRLSKVERDLEGVSYSRLPSEGIIHRKGIGELRRTMDGSDETVELAFVDNREILFRNDAGTLKVRQVDARYPNFEKVIPSSSEFRVTIPREPFVQALRLTSSIAAGKTSLVKLNFQDGRVTIVGSNPDLGEGRAEIPVDYHGNDAAIGFNYRYLLDIAGVIDDDALVMEFTDAGSQVIVRSPSDDGVLYVVMPMRV